MNGKSSDADAVTRASGVGARYGHRWQAAVMVVMLLALGTLLPTYVRARRLTTAPLPPAPTVTTLSMAGTFAVDTTTGRAYVNKGDSVDVVDTVTGKQLRTIPWPAYQIETIMLDPRTEHIFIAGEESGSVGILDSRTGVTRTVRLRPYDAARLLAVDSAAGRVYVASTRTCRIGPCTPDAIEMLDARTGAVLRTIRPATGVVALDPHAQRVIIAYAAFDRNMSIIAIVDVYDQRSGRLLRRTRLATHGVGGLPVVNTVTSRAFVILYAPTGYPEEPRIAPHPLALLATRAGGLVRTLRLAPGAVDLALDARANRLFATTYGTGLNTGPVGTGQLYTMDASNGTILRNQPIGPATTAVVVDGARERVYVASAGQLDASTSYKGLGTLTVLSERTGTVLRQVSIPMGPAQLILDAPHQRLLVACSGRDPRGGPATISILDTSHL